MVVVEVLWGCFLLSQSLVDDDDFTPIERLGSRFSFLNILFFYLLLFESHSSW